MQYLHLLLIKFSLQQRLTTCDGDISSRVDDFQPPLSHDIHVHEKLLLLWVKLLPQRLDLAAVQSVSDSVGHQSWKRSRRRDGSHRQLDPEQNQVDDRRKLRSKTTHSGDGGETAVRQTRMADFNESLDTRHRRWFHGWLTASFHPLCSRVDSVGQGTDDTQLGEQRDAAGALELRGGASQVRPHAGQRDLRSVGLENHQVSFQLFERQAALLVETSGAEQVGDMKRPFSTRPSLSTQSFLFCEGSPGINEK